MDKIIKVVTGHHYNNWYDDQARCRKCGKVEQCGDMALIDIDRDERFYCLDCAYEVVDEAREICPACRNYHYNHGTPFCSDCRKLDSAKAIAIQVNSELNRTKDPRDNLTLLDWFDTLRHYGFRCVYCRDVYTDLEHYVPVSKGGATTVDNCVPACNSCNSAKRAKMPREFLLHNDAIIIETYLKRRGEKFALKEAVKDMAFRCHDDSESYIVRYQMEIFNRPR